MCLLFQQYLVRTDQGLSFFQPPVILQPFFQSVFRTTHSAILNLQDQPTVWSLAPYCCSTINFQVHKNYSAKVQAIAILPLSGLLFWRQWCGSRGCEPLFSWMGQGEVYLLRMQNQCSSWALFQDKEKCSQDEWGKPRMLGLQPSHEPSFWIACPGFCPYKPPSLWLPGEPLSRWKGETHQEVSHYLTKLNRLEAPRLG